jgi:hypothetical protein
MEGGHTERGRTIDRYDCTRQSVKCPLQGKQWELRAWKLDGLLLFWRPYLRR